MQKAPRYCQILMEAYGLGGLGREGRGCQFCSVVGTAELFVRERIPAGVTRATGCLSPGPGTQALPVGNERVSANGGSRKGAVHSRADARCSCSMGARSRTHREASQPFAEESLMVSEVTLRCLYPLFRCPWARLLHGSCWPYLGKLGSTHHGMLHSSSHTFGAMRYYFSHSSTALFHLKRHPAF